METRKKRTTYFPDIFSSVNIYFSNVIVSYLSRTSDFLGYASKGQIKEWSNLSMKIEMERKRERERESMKLNHLIKSIFAGEVRIEVHTFLRCVTWNEGRFSKTDGCSPFSNNLWVL